MQRLAFVLLLTPCSLASAQAPRPGGEPPAAPKDGVKESYHDVTSGDIDTSDIDAKMSESARVPFFFGLAGLGCACAGAVVGLVMLMINIFILVYVYKDARARGVEPLLWMAIVFFTHFVGFVVWLFVRPPLLKSS